MHREDDCALFEERRRRHRDGERHQRQYLSFDVGESYDDEEYDDDDDYGEEEEEEDGSYYNDDDEDGEEEDVDFEVIGGEGEDAGPDLDRYRKNKSGSSAAAAAAAPASVDSLVNGAQPRSFSEE